MEQKKNRTRVTQRFREGVKVFELIAPGDSILIGLSGGKDSLTLLDLLGNMCKRSNGLFKLHALHVRMSNVDYQSNSEYLHQKCAAWNIPFIERTITFETDQNEKRTPCFLCSWNRRKTLFETAQQLGCNKIALGHHQDDILHTALMNLMYEGSFSTMPCKIEMDKMPITIIRPLCKVKEEDIKKWAEFENYQSLIKICPHDKASKRTSVGELFTNMESLNPEFRSNLWHALLKEEKLIQKRKEDINTCN
ncbi:MAG: tRNA 2-thiocytidine biosynthesis protein TtcA [Bacteroidaceae bacterium]|nr:tRNA 2-thiocytidine biosynthesis protein TtcA [Bacteroidaceae bacterium]